MDIQVVGKVGELCQGFRKIGEEIVA